MRQAILVEPKHIEFKEVAEPKAADLTAHQVLVNIKRIGICGSDIHVYHGKHPYTKYPVTQPPSTQWFRDMSTQEWLWL